MTETTNLTDTDWDWIRRIVKRDPEPFWDWVRSVAEGDRELFWEGNEEALIDSLRSISAKEDRSRLEDFYLRTVLNSDRQSADWPQSGR